MKRKVFYSFHYAKDSWRAGQVRNIGVVENDPPLTSNKWEEVKQKGDDNIVKWIQDSLVGKTCLVVLIGEETSNLDEVYEPYLLKIGLIDRTPKGRVLTEKGFKYLKEKYILTKRQKAK